MSDRLEPVVVGAGLGRRGAVTMSAEVEAEDAVAGLYRLPVL